MDFVFSPIFDDRYDAWIPWNFGRYKPDESRFLSLREKNAGNFTFGTEISKSQGFLLLF